jgi:acyl-CoA thioesterase I
MRILFQGESITDCGRGQAKGEPNFLLGDGYVMLIASKLLSENANKNIEVYNRGIGGNRIVDLYARWKIDCLNLKQDIINILLGVNDTWHEKISDIPNGVEVSRYKKIYQELLEWTLSVLPHAKLILCEPFVLPVGVVSEDWLSEIKQRGSIAERFFYKQQFNLPMHPRLTQQELDDTVAGIRNTAEKPRK